MLVIRMSEIDTLIHKYIIVEANKTFSGQNKEYKLDLGETKLAKYRHKIIHVKVDDMPHTDDPWVREAWQRDSVIRGLAEAHDSDLVILGDVDEIPRLITVEKMLMGPGSEIYGLAMPIYYYYLNYKKIGGYGLREIWTIAASKRVFLKKSPNDLRNDIRLHGHQCTRLEESGWHFSYACDLESIKQKIRSFSHQEFNNDQFLSSINLEDLVAAGKDKFGGDGRWELVDLTELPSIIRYNPQKFAKLLRNRQP